MYAVAQTMMIEAEVPKVEYVLQESSRDFTIWDIYLNNILLIFCYLHSNSKKLIDVCGRSCSLSIIYHSKFTLEGFL